MDLAAKRQHGLGGKLDPEGRVNSTRALLGSLPPWLTSALSKTRR